MFSLSGWRAIFGMWELPPPTEKKVHRLNRLEVKVDLDPVGGYRGKVGTLTINHVDHLLFTDWSEDDLRDLAALERKILHIREEALVPNTLIFGRQDKDKFKLSFVAYPKCNWIEKIQGLIHVIFGNSFLQEHEAEEIATFYSDQFEKELDLPASQGESREGAPDAFCQSAVILNQKIVDLSFNNEHYQLLHDHRPKGRTAQDPDLLIIPEGDSGHCDGSQVSLEKRLHMLKITQRVMQIFSLANYSTLLFLERNGEKLQGVHHKHMHVVGIQQFPKTFLEKIQALIRQIYTPILTNLKERIEYYQTFDWNPTSSYPRSLEDVRLKTP